MARIVFGEDFLEENTVILSLCNANSPLVWDATMLGAARAYAEAKQAVLMTPFILAGAMSPVTVAGAARRRSPRRSPGWRTSSSCGRGRPSCSARSRARCRCSRERRPSARPSRRSSSTSWPRSRGGSASRSARAARFTASKIPDAQAAYESANTMQPTMLGGVNFVLHAAGWLEGGLTMGYEKFVLDNDQCGMWHEFAKGVDLSENGQALDALLTNGPGSTSWATSTRSRTSRRPSTAPRLGQLELRAVGGRGRDARRHSARRRSGSGRWRSTSRRRSTTRSTTSCASGSSARRRPSRTRTTDEPLAELACGAARPAALRGPSVRERRGGRPRARPARRHGHRHGVAEEGHRAHARPRRAPDDSTATRSSPTSRPVSCATRPPAEILTRLDEIGAHDVFVVAGDADEPAGEYAGAAPLLEAIAEQGHRFESIGITGYPESHPLIDDETTIQSMFDKARFATHIVSQICFDPQRHAATGSSASGTAGRDCRSTSASRVPSRERSFSASRRRSGSEPRCASCAVIGAG